MTVAAAALLAACGSDKPAPASNDAVELAASAGAPGTGAETVAATPAAAAAVGGAPTVDYLVGKWSALPEDCSEVLDFRKDGTVLTPIGEAKWSLLGDQLTFDYGDGSSQKPLWIKVLSDERIEITRASGGKDIGKRC
jgi:hypothetical protein